MGTKELLNMAAMALTPQIYSQRIIKIHPKYLFALAGFALGGLVSLIVIVTEEFNGDISANLGHSQLHHLAIPVIFGLIGMVIGYAYGKKRQTREDAFRELFANYQTTNLILDHLPVLVSYVDTDLRYRYANKTYEKWMGLSMNDVYGKLVKDIVEPGSHDALIQNLPVALRGETVRFDTCREMNGNEQFLHVTLIPHVDENKSVVGFFSVVADVTRLRKRENKIRKQKEKLEELNATKDKLFSIIAHDLKNPFNSLLGFAELLHDDFETLDEPTKKEFANHIYESAQNASRLLSNLLAWSTAQRGKIEFNPSPVNINALVAENLKLLEPSAQAKNIQLQSDLHSEFLINTDHDLINTVIRNLLSNAIKFTPKNGQVNISAREVSEMQTGNYLEISVQDTGMGIAPEKLDQLFKIGKSISTAGTEGESGTGLGLMLCKEFVEKCGGNIRVTSKLGQGSVFSFTVPKGDSRGKRI